MTDTIALCIGFIAIAAAFAMIWRHISDDIGTGIAEENDKDWWDRQ